MIKTTIKALSNKEQMFLKEVWLEHLIKAAELQGAKPLVKYIATTSDWNGKPTVNHRRKECAEPNDIMVKPGKRT